MASLPGNEGRITQARVIVRGGMRVFSVCFWHSEGWTPRKEALLEAVLKRARVTRHSWLVACDADMNPAEFEKNFHVVAPEEASTCRRKGAKGEWIEKIYDNVIACHSLKRNISQMKVVEDFESTPHKAAPFVVERDKEEQEWNEQRMQKVLPGYSGGRLPGRSAKERG